MARKMFVPTNPWSGPKAMATHLRTIETSWVKNVQTPTVERALKSDGGMHVGADRIVRLTDSLLEKLAARGALAENKDKYLNAIRLKGGQYYYDHWYLGGLSPLGAMDPGRIKVDGGQIGASTGVIPTDSAMGHRDKFHKARIYLGDEFSPTVDAVVLREEPLVEVGRRIRAYSSDHAAIAVALDRLILGLSRLVVHYRVGHT